MTTPRPATDDETVHRPADTGNFGQGDAGPRTTIRDATVSGFGDGIPVVAVLPVVVVDPDDLCRIAVTSLLVQAGMSVQAGVTSGGAALDVLGRERVGMLVTEIVLPDMALVDFLGQARSVQPWVKTIGFTGEHEPEVLGNALTLGLSGLFSKYDDPLLLGRRLRMAAAGGLVLDEITGRAVRDLLGCGGGYAPTLAIRERQVLSLIRDGHTARSAASKLYLSESTVKSHAAKAASRLGTRSSRQAAEKAWRLGLLED